MITNESVQKVKYDQWRYVSILTDIRSFDYIMKKRQDAIDLIIAVNASIQRNIEQEFKSQIEQIKLDFKKNFNLDQKSVKLSKNEEIVEDPEKEKQRRIKKEMVNYDYLNQMIKWNTNSRALKFEFIRGKIKHMANESGYTMG